VNYFIDLKKYELIEYSSLLVCIYLFSEIFFYLVYCKYKFFILFYIKNNF